MHKGCLELQQGKNCKDGYINTQERQAPFQECAAVNIADIITFTL